MNLFMGFLPHDALALQVFAITYTPYGVRSILCSPGIRGDGDDLFLMLHW